MAKEKKEIIVTPEKVSKTISQGEAAGWKLIESRVKKGQMVLTFERNLPLSKSCLQTFAQFIGGFIVICLILIVLGNILGTDDDDLQPTPVANSGANPLRAGTEVAVTIRPSQTPIRATSTPSLRSLPGFIFRQQTDASDFIIYSYTDQSEQYGLTFAAPIPTVVHDYSTRHNMSHVTREIEGVEVEYGYNSALVVDRKIVIEAYESLAFDFEHNGLTYSGEISNLAGEPSQRELLKILEKFVGIIVAQYPADTPAHSQSESTTPIQIGIVGGLEVFPLPERTRRLFAAVSDFNPYVYGRTQDKELIYILYFDGDLTAGWAQRGHLNLTDREVNGLIVVDPENPPSLPALPYDQQAARPFGASNSNPPTAASGGNATQSVSTQVQPTQKIPGSVTCGGATTCGQITSCEQAYACLRAGQSGLDRDKDGVPCESICPGG